MSLPVAFLNGLPDDDREVMQLISSLMDEMTDRQRTRGLEPEPLDRVMMGPGGVATLDMDFILAELSQLKLDMKKMTAANNAIYAGIVHFATKYKKQIKINETNRKKIKALDKKLA